MEIVIALLFYVVGLIGAFLVGIKKDRIGLGILLGMFSGMFGFVVMLFVKSSSEKMKEQAKFIAEATNVGSSSVTTGALIGDGPENAPSSETSEGNNSANEIELELKKIEGMFEKSLITEEEKKRMRNRVLGVR